jgi:carboxymethylenebutenolidase
MQLLLASAALVLVGVAAVLLGAAPAVKKSAPQPAAVDTFRVSIGPADSAFVAMPSGSKPVPSVIVAFEWWGLNGQIRDVARRLATQGYAAIVPDLYHGKFADDPETAHTLSRGLDEDRALADCDGATHWLRAQSRTVKGRLGVIGFCMGGRISQLYALHEPTVAACVMFYGRPETNPLRLAALKAPLQGHFGADDQGIPPDSAAVLRDALKAAGKTAEIYVYPGAGHAFMHEGRDSYRVDAARQAWGRTLAFFEKYLRG